VYTDLMISCDWHQPVKLPRMLKTSGHCRLSIRSREEEELRSEVRIECNDMQTERRLNRKRSLYSSCLAAGVGNRGPVRETA
jgi:hypothetical protein